MNLAYMTVLTPSEMISAPAVAVLFAERMLGPFAFIIPLGVALSTFGCAMSIQFATTRFVCCIFKFCLNRSENISITQVVLCVWPRRTLS